MATVILHSSSVLMVTADEKSTGTLIRKPASFGDSFVYSIQRIFPSTKVSVGPYNSTTLWDISDSLEYEVLLDRRTDNQYGTGIYSGGLLSINANNTKIDISAGSGTIVDNYSNPDSPAIIKVEWEDKIAVPVTYLTTSFTSYIAIDKSGQVIQFPEKLTPEQRRDYIQLGVLVHTDLATVVGIGNTQIPGYDYSHMLIDLCDTLGAINKEGNVFYANGANLKVNKTEGKTFTPGVNWPNSQKSPNLTHDDALIAPTMFRSFRDGLGGWAQPVLSDLVDVSKYDTGDTTLTNVPASDPFTVFRFWYAPSNGNVIIAYGQNVYKSIALAEAVLHSESFIQNPVLNDQSFRGYLIVRYNCTSLQDTSKAKFIPASKLTERASTGQFYSTVSGGTTANRPATPTAYFVYYDTTINKLICYNGTNWVDSEGNTA